MTLAFAAAGWHRCRLKFGVQWSVRFPLPAAPGGGRDVRGVRPVKPTNRKLPQGIVRLYALANDPGSKGRHSAGRCLASRRPL